MSVLLRLTCRRCDYEIETTERDVWCAFCHSVMRVTGIVAEDDTEDTDRLAVGV